MRWVFFSVVISYICCLGGVYTCLVSAISELGCSFVLSIDSIYHICVEQGIVILPDPCSQTTVHQEVMTCTFSSFLFDDADSAYPSPTTSAVATIHTGLVQLSVQFSRHRSVAGNFAAILQAGLMRGTRFNNLETILGFICSPTRLSRASKWIL